MAGLVGQVFEGRYAIHQLLGQGAFGAVYRATQLAMGREVAVKVLKAELIQEPSLAARFRQEARTLAGLKHPGIIELIDFGQSADGRLFLVMEFLTGETLAELLEREAPLPQARVVSLAIEALDALADAHHAGIIHRDLKPENFFIARQGRRGDALKVLDFGIAKLADDDPARMAVTADGMTLGSPRFMSPEQCMAGPVSAQSDLYSLGLVLYEAIGDRPAFEKQSAMEYMMAHVNEAPKPPSVGGVTLRGPHIDVIMSCLQKDPARRPASAAEMAAALQAVHSRLPTVMGAGPAVGGGVEATQFVGAEATQFVGAGAGRGADEAAVTVAVPVEAAVARALAAGAEAPRAAEPPSDAWTVVAPSPIAAKAGGRPGPSHGYDGVSTANTRALTARPLVLAGAGAVALLLLVGGLWATLGGGGAEDGAAKEAAAAKVEQDGPSQERAGADGPAERPAGTPEPAHEDEAAPAQIAEAAPKTLTVTVDSKPSGATVWRDEEELGRTPVELSWGADEAPPALKLRLAGYDSSAVTPRVEDAGGRLIVELSARVEEAPALRAVRAENPPEQRAARKPARKSAAEKPRFKMVE